MTWGEISEILLQARMTLVMSTWSHQFSSLWQSMLTWGEGQVGGMEQVGDIEEVE